MTRKIARGGRLARVVLMAVLMVALSVFGSGNQASATEGFRGLLISPANQRIELKNGQLYSGQMSVQNTTTENMGVDMSVGSYSIVNNEYGAPNYDNPSKYSLMRGWIKLDRQSLDLKPGESAIVNYLITTPVNPPSGMQYATIFAQTRAQEAKGSGITATSRVGLVLSARMVDGVTIEKSSIQQERIAYYQPVAPMRASFSVKNEGNVGVDVSYSLKVNSAINGRQIYASKPQSESVYPETVRDFNLSWDQVGVGFYRVEMSITMNGRTHTVRKTVCTVPAWIIILLIIALLSLIAYAVINYRMMRESRANRKAKAKPKVKASPRVNKGRK